MRCLVLILLLAAASQAQQVDPSLHETLAWRGVVEADGTGRDPAVTKGEEVQKERIEFLLVTDPPRTSVGWPTLPFRMRDAAGRYSLDVDVREGEGDAAIATRGAGSGDLHPTVRGHVEPTTGRYSLAIEVSPVALTGVATLSGLWDGRFVTWRTALQRTPFLAGFRQEGELAEEGRVIRGESTLIDRRGGNAREVRVKWFVERLDPAIRGRVEDHLGRPVAGLKVRARNQTAERIRQGLPPQVREGVTGEDGQFRIPAYRGAWQVQVLGNQRAGLIYAGHALESPVDVRFDDVPRLEVRVEAYRLHLLPDAPLLRSHFGGDVDGYIEYQRLKLPKRAFERALDTPPGEAEVASQAAAEDE